MSGRTEVVATGFTAIALFVVAIVAVAGFWTWIVTVLGGAIALETGWFEPFGAWPTGFVFGLVAMLVSGVFKGGNTS